MPEVSKDSPQAGDNFFLRGCFDVVLRNAKTQEIVARRHVDNVVVTSGRRFVLERLQSVSPPAETFIEMAIGSSTTNAPATGDTILGSEDDRKAIGTYDTAELTSNPPSWEASSSWATNENNSTIGEVGLFNSTAAGTMLARATFATLDKKTSNTLTISYTISN